MKASELFALLTVVFAVLANVAPAQAGVGHQCKDLSKPAVNGCQTRVKAECTQDKYFDRRRCEDVIATELDICRGPEFAAAVKAARKAYAVCGQTETTLTTSWFEVALTIEEQAQSYQSLYAEWSACSKGNRDARYHLSNRNNELCRKAPSKFKANWQAWVDTYFTSNTMDAAQRSLDAAKKDPSDRNLSNLESVSARERRKANQLVAVNSQLPTHLRYKVSELQNAAKMYGMLLNQHQDIERQVIAKRRCPAGKRLPRKFKRILDSASKRNPNPNIKVLVRRQSGAKLRSVNKLITLETVPIVSCYEYRPEGKDKYCKSNDSSLYREKAPGSPWTSWRKTGVGVGVLINCALVD